VKYKPGDIVRIKTLDQLKKEFPKQGYSLSRYPFFGKPVTIKTASPGMPNASHPVEPFYYVHGSGLWSESYIEGVIV